MIKFVLKYTWACIVLAMFVAVMELTAYLIACGLLFFLLVVTSIYLYKAIKNKKTGLSLFLLIVIMVEMLFFYSFATSFNVEEKNNNENSIVTVSKNTLEYNIDGEEILINKYIGESADTIIFPKEYNIEGNTYKLNKLNLSKLEDIKCNKLILCDHLEICLDESKYPSIKYIEIKENTKLGGDVNKILDYFSTLESVYYSGSEHQWKINNIEYRIPNNIKYE